MSPGRAIIEEPRKPFWAKCTICQHVWAAAYYPMMLEEMGKLLGSLHCPNCAADAKKITPAKQDDGKLLAEDA